MGRNNPFYISHFTVFKSQLHLFSCYDVLTVSEEDEPLVLRAHGPTSGNCSVIVHPFECHPNTKDNNKHDPHRKYQPGTHCVLSVYVLSCTQRQENTQSIVFHWQCFRFIMSLINISANVQGNIKTVSQCQNVNINVVKLYWYKQDILYFIMDLITVEVFIIFTTCGDKIL